MCGSSLARISAPSAGMTRIRFDGLADASQPDASAGHPIEIAAKYLSPRRRSFKGNSPDAARIEVGHFRDARTQGHRGVRAVRLARASRFSTHAQACRASRSEIAERQEPHTMTGASILHSFRSRVA
jgi:hypothetical protein